MRLGRLGAAILLLTPTSPVLVATATVAPLAIAGCSGSNFNETKLNEHANQRAIFHVKLAKLHDDIVTAFVKDIDNHNVSPKAKAKLLEWNEKLKDSRGKLLKAFSTNNTDDVIAIISELDAGRPTREQEQAHYMRAFGQA